MRRGPFVLITGAAGFLGSHLARVCADAGYSLIGVGRHQPAEPEIFSHYIEADIDKVEWSGLIRATPPVACFHLASTASVPASVKEPLADFARVLPTTGRLLHALSGVATVRPRFVFFSSAAVYGNPKALPVDENAEVRPISPYGLHKHVAEQMVYGAAVCFGLAAVNLRIFSAYGNGLRRQLFFDVDTKARMALASGEHEIRLSGTGNEARDFIHGRDVARAALLVSQCELERECATFNLATGKEITIREAANLYLRQADLPVDVRFDGSVRTGDPLVWRADVTRIRSLGFNHEVELEAGLRQYAAWVTHS
jgi:UDP-glucose 4-epimerase